MKKALLILLPVLATASCLDSRERLQPPRVYLRLNGTGVVPGGQLFGRVSGYDASGIVYVNAVLRIEGDTGRARSASASGFEADTVDFDFNLEVKTGFPPGTRLFVTAMIRDDENFEIAVMDTSVIR